MYPLSTSHTSTNVSCLPPLAVTLVICFLISFLVSLGSTPKSFPWNVWMSPRFPPISFLNISTTFSTFSPAYPSANLPIPLHHIGRKNILFFSMLLTLYFASNLSRTRPTVAGERLSLWPVEVTKWAITDERDVRCGCTWFGTST